MTTRFLTRLVLLISLTLIIEMIGLPQFFTGPLVNMMLLLTTLLLGPAAGVILGIITPVVAVIRGQLPAVLAPMVPFIIVGNASLVLLFHLITRYSPMPASHVVLSSLKTWAGLLAGALFKTAWLYISASLLLPILFGKSLPPRLLALMATPQLITAIVGGCAAVLFYSLLSGRLK